MGLSSYEFIFVQPINKCIDLSNKRPKWRIVISLLCSFLFFFNPNVAIVEIFLQVFLVKLWGEAETSSQIIPAHT